MRIKSPWAWGTQNGPGRTGLSRAVFASEIQHDRIPENNHLFIPSAHDVNREVLR
jgi:hypothetical protein